MKQNKENREIKYIRKVRTHMSILISIFLMIGVITLVIYDVKLDYIMLLKVLMVIGITFALTIWVYIFLRATSVIERLIR